MLVGLQGSGKTTTAIKLALLARREGHKPLLAALDLRRPAAIDQLRTLAEREGVAFRAGSGPVEDIARAAVGEARRLLCDVVILDTAGRLHVDQELMDELKRLKSAVQVSETLLVADSMTGQEAVKVGEAFGKEVGLDGVVLTKLDGDARGGAALSLRVATGQRIRFAGTGEKPQDLEVFHAERMASRILGMGDVLTLIERAEQSLDKEKAVEVERHLRAGRLTFDDFLTQIRQVRGMGSLEGMLDMIPGGAALKKQVAGAGEAGRAQGAPPIDSEGEVRRMEAIILSMTPRERAHPEVIDGARKRRIARGSGVQPADVNRVLKARETMQKLAKQFGSVNRRGNAAGVPRLFGKGGAGW
jgi:signal recognition particle subunit SRP54